MDLNNIMLDYEKTLPGVTGDILLEEGKFYAFPGLYRGNSYNTRFIYIDKIIETRKKFYIFYIKEWLNGNYYGRMKEVSMGWIRHVSYDSIFDVTHDEDIPQIVQGDSDSYSEWGHQLKTVSVIKWNVYPGERATESLWLVD